MKSSAASSEAELSEEERRALIKLLADEDPFVYERVRRRIVSAGPTSLEWLKPHLLSSDPLVRRRTRAIINLFARHACDNEFVVFCLTSGNDLDLERGVLLLSRTAYPEGNVEAYSALLDEYATTLRERAGTASTAGEILKCFRDYLFGKLGFVGNTGDYYDPDNSYFTRVIDRRTGNPISLCTVYLLLARRLGLPVAGIGLPGHFLCRYQTSSAEVYIDAFNGGKLMSKADCVRYLVRAGHPTNEEHLSPVSTRKMLLRMCGNLHQIYAPSQSSEEATRLRRYIVALSK